ncbi:ATP synthase F0 subcomplex B subunit [Nitrosospira sp. Nsp5]|uniref:ATP synthase subunit b n=1 Tax=Nitrosospira multiformis TaxID=1231 RepID=A0ABY0TG61_9PROT|nr:MULTISPECIES: F0F1 ATP synthase subunit delta [Nitrosospira]PTR10669.1 ATP synthase F0 subcomplex B subunit [Nitrosospira sp. Nsp5]SDQ78175.1 ATP synthase F0 subcomplex B subunit [Nitrosospira multiformis]
MLIDWFTVIAQVVNFLILVWLLKRFFYKPILKALDAREQRIAAELADADAKKTEAEKERNAFQHKHDEFEQQRAALLSKASAEARTERRRLIAAAREDADNLRTRREEALRREYQSLSETLTRRIGTEVFAIARKVLADLANTTLEAHIAEAFIGRMRELSPNEKARLASTIRTPPPSAAISAPAVLATAGMGATAASVLVRSAFDLPAAQQEAIAAVIRESLGADISVQFATEPELIGGIELVTHGHKVAWSIAGYLSSLEKEIGRLLKNHVEGELESESSSDAEARSETDRSAKERNKGQEKVTVLKPRT